ncbi:hypothetical protein JW899_04320 [Candidatus Uhrbacteria bacterium]|nr:hypothetical protein [Candidatus Uhrbacteria bacterium]
MKKTTLIVAGLAVIVSLTTLMYGLDGKDQGGSATPQGDGTRLLVNALRTEPDFRVDTLDSSMIVQGEVIAVDELSDQPLSHNTRITISVDQLIKGDDVSETIEVYALGGGGVEVVGDNEKIGLVAGDVGIFFLGWMPVSEGFYTFFGGSRGVYVEKDAHIRNWGGKSIKTDRFVREIEKVLADPDDREHQKTLGEMIRDKESE